MNKAISELKIALDLSGGGAKGAFIIGYIYGMFIRGIRFHCVAGVSVGALIAAMIAQGKIMECVNYFLNVRGEDIHHKYSKTSILYRLLVEGRKGLYNPRGLHKLVDENVKKDGLLMPCYAGFVSLYDKQYYGLSQVNFDDEENFRNAVKASALMPVIWEGIPEIKLNDGRILKDCVDGGIRNNVPLADILQEEPDIIYIIQCDTGKDEPKEMKTFLDVASRVLDIVLSEIVTTDTRDLLRINNLVKQTENRGGLFKDDGKPYKYYEAKVIRPKEDLGGNLDFSPEEMERRFMMGYYQALDDHPIEIYGV